MYFLSSLLTDLRAFFCLNLLSHVASPETNDQNYIDLEFSEVTFDYNRSREEEDSSLSYLEQGLCVPNDRLEDIDFFPNFVDDWIRLDDVDLKCNQEDSGKFSCNNRLNSRDEEEIACKGTSESYVGEDDVHEHKFNLDCNDNNDDRFPSISVEHEEAWKGKKPRMNIVRKVNHRSSISSRCMKMKRKRRCSHCDAEKTPQWRLGPLGPNSLCNACGLRYKIGRLLLNYRPAASPSFDCNKHSNFYKRLARMKLW